MKKIIVAIKQFQSVILSVSILLFCIIGFIFGVMPAGQKALTQASELQSLEGEVQKLRSKSKLLDSLDEDTLRNQLAVALSAVPADRSLPTVFSTVEAVAASTNVSVLTMNVTGGQALATGSAEKESPLETKLGARIVPTTVSIEGTIDNLEKFIALIPEVRRLFRIRTFSISFSNIRAPITVAIQMDAFYAPFPTSLGNASSDIAVLSKDEDAVLTRLAQFPHVGAFDATKIAPVIGKVKGDPFSR